jgi:hypothetical protein
MYYIGGCSNNVKHTQLHMHYTVSLNAHVCSRHVVHSPQCNKHDLLNCHLYILPSLKMLQTVDNLWQSVRILALHFKTLLYRFNDFVYSSNKETLRLSIHL